MHNKHYSAFKQIKSISLFHRIIMVIYFRQKNSATGDAALKKTTNGGWRSLENLRGKFKI